MPDYGHAGRPSTYLVVARDFDQIARHLIRETSTFKSTKVVGCRFPSISTKHRPASEREIDEPFARTFCSLELFERRSIEFSGLTLDPKRSDPARSRFLK